MGNVLFSLVVVVLALGSTNFFLKPRGFLYKTHAVIYILLYGTSTICIFLYNGLHLDAITILYTCVISAALIILKIGTSLFAYKGSVRTAIQISISKYSEVFMQQVAYANIVPFLLLRHIPIDISVPVFMLFHVPLFLFLRRDVATLLFAGSGIAFVLFLVIYTNYQNAFLLSLSVHMFLYYVYDVLSSVRPSLCYND